jgi:hypothetical protein
VDIDPRESASATATGTNAGATATISGKTDQQFCVTHVSGRSDAAAQLTILGGAAGATIVWQIGIAANVPFAVTFPRGAVLGVEGQSVAGKVSASTAACEVNVVAEKLSLA